MTTEQMVRRVKILLQNDPVATDEVVYEYLEMAEDTALNTLYPYGVPEGAVLPERYHGVMCELAARLFVRRGGYGEILHIENGIHRDWYSADDRELLARITPYLKVR
jgi:hypothetical protein